MLLSFTCKKGVDNDVVDGGIGRPRKCLQVQHVDGLFDTSGWGAFGIWQ